MNLSLLLLIATAYAEIIYEIDNKDECNIAASD
jgi:hypothetical protein